jgi:hypothetical protein
MSRPFRLWLPLLVLLSIGLQTVSPVSAGLRESKAVSLMEKGDPSQTDADASQDGLEDDEDSKTLHRISIDLLSTLAQVSAARLNWLFGQHRPDTSVPPPKG